MTTKAVIDKNSKKYKEYCDNITEDEINEALTVLNKYIGRKGDDIFIKDEYKKEARKMKYEVDEFADAIYDFVEYKNPTCYTAYNARMIREEENPMDLIYMALYKRHSNRKTYAKNRERAEKEKKQKEEHPALEYMFIRESGIIVSRDIDNPNENTFDFVSVEVFRGTYSIEFIKEHKNEIMDAVLYKISQSRKFIKFNVPVNILKLDKIRIIGCDMIFYFSVKKL